MARPTGLPKTGGRKKGTPNRKSAELVNALESLKFNVPEQLIEIMPQLDIEKRADILLSLMEFIYPKRKAVEHVEQNDQVDESKCITVQFVRPTNHKIKNP